MEDSKMKTLMKLSLALMVIILLTSVSFAQSTDNKEYDQYLIKSLQDENIGIRCSAAKLLGERKVTDAVKPLTKMLKYEQNTSARIVYAMALYQIGDDKALPTLKKVASRDKNKTVRRVVSAIVREMEDVQVAQK